MNVAAQPACLDSLILYTKQDCSNCQATKQAFQQYGLNYIEKNLENEKYAAEMLRKLSGSGYHKEIYLPVIFLNNKLYHPVYKSDTGMVYLPLNAVVDSFKNKFRRKELNLAVSNNNNVLKIQGTVTSNSDCEMKASPVYLICATYKTENEAKTVMNKLIASGNTYAGMINYHNQFRVFSKFFYDHEAAKSELNEIKKTFKDAYLFEIPSN